MSSTVSWIIILVIVVVAVAAVVIRRRGGLSVKGFHLPSLSGAGGNSSQTTAEKLQAQKEIEEQRTQALQDELKAKQELMRVRKANIALKKEIDSTTELNVDKKKPPVSGMGA